MFGGRNMGGGGGGGSLLRSAGRAVTRANFSGGPHQEPLSSSSTNSGTTTTSTTTNSPRHAQKAKSSSSNNNLSLSSPSSSSSSSSSPFASFNAPVSTIYGLPTSSSWPHSDEFDWVSVDAEGYADHGFVDDFVLGPVPSEDEVHSAVSALQQVFNADSYSNLIRDKFATGMDKDEEHQVMSPTCLAHRVSPLGSELDWMEPSFCMCNSKMLQRHGSERVYDAFQLLRTEPLVQKMVKSLSSDEAVWNAVLKNEVVRELRESFSAAEDNGLKNPEDESPENSNETTNIVKWIFDSTRGKLLEVFEKITKLMSDLFQSPESEKTTASGGTDLFKEKLRTSFMLSIMVLLVVVVARAHKA